MAGVSIDDFNADFIDYLPGVTETLENTTMLRSMARNDYRWEGTHIEFIVHTARNHALGYIEDGGALQVADKQDFERAQAFRRFLTGSVQITDGQLANAATTRRAARDVVTSELRGMIEGMSKFENFFAYRDGTGVVGLLGTDVTGTTISMDDARLMWRGQTYEVYDNTDLTATGLRGTFTVERVLRALNGNNEFEIVISAALPAGSVATDFVVWPGALNRAVTGLQSLVDDTSTTFQNINTANEPRFTSPVLDGGGTNRPLEPTLYRQILAVIRQESGNMPGRRLTVLSNLWGMIEHEELYESEVRLKPSDTTSGFKIATFQSAMGTIEIVPDHDCPFNQLFFVDWSQIYRAVQKELDWRPATNGGGIFMRSDQSTVYRANAIEIMEYFIKQRNRCARLDDISQDVVSAY